MQGLHEVSLNQKQPEGGVWRTPVSRSKQERRPTSRGNSRREDTAAKAGKTIARGQNMYQL